ncbi:MAG: 23S rRNA (guanosine(2251)-2'-O)-methyltransferase RlmB [Gemmatimonadetes bacterium]|nr:23S rRNA (guanosine(2251)-2'-O)-methyltransferase RlmB [Gemmatimonadota bacterium]
MSSSSRTAGEGTACGRRAVAEALAAGHPVNRIYFARQAKGPEIERIKELARQRQVRFDFVDVGKLGNLAGTREHQDVVARLSPVGYARFEELLEQAEKVERMAVVALDQLQHPHNVGMILRTAAGAGVGGVLLTARSGRLISDEVVRASSGAVFRIPIVASSHFQRDLEALKANGFWVYGLDAGGEDELFAVEWAAKRVLVAGNETKGLSRLVRKTVDARVRIPLAGEMDSLNVAMATGIALFDGVRQDGRADGR